MDLPEVEWEGVDVIWLWLKVNGDLLRAQYEPSGSIKCRDFLTGRATVGFLRRIWVDGLPAKHILEFSSFQKARLRCCVPYVRTVPRIASQNECVDPFKSLFLLAFPPLSECIGIVAGCCTVGLVVLWPMALVLRTLTSRDETALCTKHRTDHSQFRFLYVPIFIRSSAFQVIETRSTVVHFSNCDTHTGLDVWSWMALETKAARFSEILAPIYQSARRHFTEKTAVYL